MSSIPILSPDQSGAWDSQADSSGVALVTLMETAGRATAAVLGMRFRGQLAGGVLVAAGPGNNGGDGWVLARALHRLELPVWVVPCDGTPSPLNTRMRSLAETEGVRTVAPDGPWPGVELTVDAILGTGAKGAPRPAAQQLLDRLHELAVPVVAIDGPTGVDLATGAVYGHAYADLSITFGGLRRGHVLARDQVGDVVVVDIGHPDPDPAWPVVMTDQLAIEWLPRFEARAHKGTRGRVVIVGGDQGMSGALRLAGRAAFAAGAGLVHVVAPQETVDAIVGAEPDLQMAVQGFGSPLAAAVEDLVARADVLVIGPGLGRGEGRARLVLSLIELAGQSVIDADGLTALRGHLDEVKAIATDHSLILTPHPGEFRGLFPDLAGQSEVDPWQAASGATDMIGATVVLKGAPSVVASPGATAMTIVSGNPGLATGGSGDVLSGLIGSLLGQGMSPARSAALGAQILGRAADLVGRRAGVRGLRPMDVVATVPELWHSWGRRGRRSVGSVQPPVLLDLPRPLA